MIFRGVQKAALFSLQFLFAAHLFRPNVITEFRSQLKNVVYFGARSQTTQGFNLSIMVIQCPTYCRTMWDESEVTLWACLCFVLELSLQIRNNSGTNTVPRADL